ncbi:TIGR03086 family metal-binding protein [Nonomuraea aridisoli]|uniref:TIGR03086 family protein n=1 Tax=Nonomuraea aridisoli TaxID=2070368 RepID=A0A2W2EPM4_9ACTN|nr:TIGR03086 family metal-binding protein [Nonomuraea aridisoli]PZG14318.1 TIGR03086 family protein [Nonomuraea aridisoli]
MSVIDLESAAREVVRLLDGVADDQLDDPTPCADTSVAALLDHLMGLSLAFTWAARKTPPPGDGPRPGTESAEQLDPQWRTLLPQRLDELVKAWRDPLAWEGTTEAGGVTMPAEQMAVVALDELVLHGWDLARATGQPFTCTPADTAAVLAFTTASAQPEQAAGREGLFGPVVEVPEDAPAFDRALGFAGRDPAWTPESA